MSLGYPQDIPKMPKDAPKMFNRPGVAGAVLQTPPLPIK